MMDKQTLELETAKVKNLLYCMVLRWVKNALKNGLDKQEIVEEIDLVLELANKEE